MQIEELLYQFMDNLTAGTTFNVGSKMVMVKSISKERNMRWEINGETKSLYCLYGGYYGTKGKGRDWFDNMLKDIEGVLIIDLLNINNPLHEFSKIYHIANSNNMVQNNA